MRTTTPRGACAITGGAFYSPLTARFPSDYSNDYFFADYCAGWIRKLDPAAGNSVVTFATGISSPVDLKVSDDGGLYYLARGTGATTGVVYRIDYGATTPSITMHPASQTVQPGASVTFSVRASGPPVLRYQWQRNGVDIAGATAEDYTASAVQSDSGARFRARVSNDVGSVHSNEAVLTVAANQAPTGSISQPATGALYSGGSVITMPERRRIPSKARCRGLPLRGGSTSITTPTSIRSSPRPRERPAGHSPFPRQGIPNPTCGIEST